MKTLSVYKYKLYPTTESIIIPGNAKILSCIAQGEDVVVYALVDIEDKTVREVNYIVLGTGHDIYEDKLDGFTLLNTVLMNYGLVFHVFIKDNSI